MKLEVGKTYKTRGGDKAEIYAYKPENFRYSLMFGAVLLKCNRWFQKEWHESGLFDDSESPYDIISEWVEPIEFECHVKWVEGEIDSLHPSPISYMTNSKDLLGKKGKLTFKEDI